MLPVIGTKIALLTVPPPGNFPGFSPSPISAPQEFPGILPPLRVGVPIVRSSPPPVQRESPWQSASGYLTLQHGGRVVRWGVVVAFNTAATQSLNIPPYVSFWLASLVNWRAFFLSLARVPAS